MTVPPVIEQTGAPRNGPAVIAHEVSLESKPYPVTVIAWPFVPTIGVTATEGVTVNVAVPLSVGSVQVRVIVYGAPPAARGAVPTVNDPATVLVAGETVTVAEVTKFATLPVIEQVVEIEYVAPVVEWKFTTSPSFPVAAERKRLRGLPCTLGTLTEEIVTNSDEVSNSTMINELTLRVRKATHTG